MEDLFPLVIFLVIVGVNVVKFFAEKGKAKSPPVEGQPQPRRKPSSLESFFENLAEQMAPKPTEVPDWPKGRERPNYAREMEEFEEEKNPAVIPFQAPEPQPKPPTAEGILPMRSKRVRLQLKGGKSLRQAMLAHIVFSPPRALDPSYNDTFAKHITKPN